MPALYGECPRLKSGEGKEAVPDAGGEIQAHSPLSCLRKGAAEGWAEVEFLGNDEARYVAKWRAFRAHSKANGKLQAPQWSVKNVETGVIVDKDKPVSELIVRTTGLTYDEFRRTVLLAQGEFDNLLRANPAERAILLEKITGTEIYRQISCRAFERWQDTEKVVKSLEDQMSGHAVMSDETQSAKLIEREALQEEDARASVRLADINALVGRHEAIAKAQGDLDDAKGRLFAATAEFDSACEDRRRHDLLVRAQPLRDPLARVKKCSEAIKKAIEQVQLSNAALMAAEAAHSEAADKARQTSKSLREIDEMVVAFEPEWLRAAGLDSVIVGAREEYTRAQEEAHEAKAHLGTIKTGFESADSELTASKEALSAANQLALRVAPLKSIGERWDEVETKLAKRRDLNNERLETLNEIERLQVAAGGSKETLERIEQGDKDDFEARASLDTKISEERTTLVRLDEGHLEARSGILTDLAEAIGNMARAADDYCKSRDDIAMATNAVRTAAGEIEIATSAEVAAREDKARAQAVLTGFSGIAERAEATISPEAAKLRMGLSPGEDCPVCGSREHPIHDDDTLASIARELRSKIDVAKSASHAADLRIIEARALKAEADARLSAAMTQSERSRSLMQQASDRYAENLRAATEPWATVSLSGTLPRNPAGFDGTWAKSLETARAECSTSLESARKLRRSIDGLLVKREKLTEAIESRSSEKERAQHVLATQHSNMKLAQQALDIAAERIRSSDRELGSWLAPANIGPNDLYLDPDGSLSTLRTSSNAWRDAQAGLLVAETAVREIGPVVADLRGKLVSAQEMLLKKNDAVNIRRSALDTRLQERQSVLGGEATDAHKARFNSQRAETARLYQLAIGQSAAAETQLATAKQGVSHSEQWHNEANSEAGQAEDAFGVALSKSGIERDIAETLLAVPDDEIATLHARLSELDVAVLKARASIDEREMDLALAMAAGEPEVTCDDLKTAAAALAVLQKENQGRIGSISAELAEDERQKAAVASLLVEIAAASLGAKLWSEITDAIGSKDGTKFARIAQSITLEILIDLANEHLAELNSRYSLVKTGELGFHVVDADFGDERRSTRSLSGGERFLVSLALAVALSGLGGRQTFANTLFIDEGFGSLDADTLDVAITALETLQSQGRNVGVISHVEAMKERIPVQIQVTKQGGGKSVVNILGPQMAA